MKVSFDLDETLICYAAGVPRESGHVPWPLRRWLREPLRQGAVALLQQLQELGHEVVIYTTSRRSPLAVRRWLRCYGIRIEQVINQAAHERAVSRLSLASPPTKLPPVFGIDLHVDDSPGVGVEGKQHGFDVLVVSPDDRDWTTRVLEAVTSAVNK